MPGHPAGHGVDGVGHLDAPSLEGAGQLNCDVLSLGHGQPVARHDKNLAGVGEQRPDVGGVAAADCPALNRPAGIRSAGRSGAKAPEDDVGQ